MSGTIFEDSRLLLLRVCVAVTLKNKSVWWVLPLLAADCGMYAAAALYFGATLAAQNWTEEGAALRVLWLTSSLATLVLAAAIGLLAIGFAYLLTFKPIHQISAMALAVGAGDFGKRLGFTRRDELGRLARQMDRLSDQLQHARVVSEAQFEVLDQLRRLDRIAILDRLASSFARELGRPLEVVEERAQLITTDRITTLPEARRNAQLISVEARRMTRLVGELVSCSHQHPARQAPLDLVLVVREAIALSEHKAKRRDQTIELDVTEVTLDMSGDANKLLQVFVNLLLNGIQASAIGGNVHVILRNVWQAARNEPQGPKQNFACIDVIDRGTGIPPDALATIFDPSFSSKSLGEGGGFGLSVAQGIATEHDGWIEVNSQLGRGSHFSVYLPRRPKGR